MSENELTHYGRKGMKWYQKIFSKDSESGTKSSGSGNKSGSSKKEKLSDVSDQDLQKRITRLRMEADYKALTAKKDKVSKGKEMVVNWLESAGKNFLDEYFRSLGRNVGIRQQKEWEAAFKESQNKKKGK